MEIFGLLLDGMAVSLQPLNIGLILIGVTLGLFMELCRGLGSVNGVAILLPVTFLVPPGSAIIFLAAIYYGAMYGGAISSIYAWHSRRVYSSPQRRLTVDRWR